MRALDPEVVDAVWAAMSRCSRRSRSMSIPLAVTEPGFRIGFASRAS